MVVNPLKKPQDDQLWTPVKTHFNENLTEFSHFSLKKPRESDIHDCKKYFCFGDRLLFSV